LREEKRNVCTWERSLARGEKTSIKQRTRQSKGGVGGVNRMLGESTEGRKICKRK